MVVKIVIGANFGDEGKGLMTDYFCHQAASENKKCIVVLYNGGAQRGHTVCTPDGIRHVFHHFGSGTLAGADTYLSEDYIINPMVFHIEFEELKTLGCKPNVFVNESCKVSTPFDMIANQIIEENRGENKHGSCGHGIWETIRRYEKFPLYPKYSFTLPGFNLSSKVNIDRFELKKIWNDYFIPRLEEKGCVISDEWKEIVENENLITRYIDDVCFLIENTKYSCPNDAVLSDYDEVVFEGGQGLLLDQNNEEYIPNITPSNTGLDNPLKIMKNLPKEEMDCEVCYVTRTYLTRHGNGKFKNECSKEEINPSIMDFTNMPNIHQGELRYGKLDLYELRSRVLEDFKKCDDSFKISLAVTHLSTLEIIKQIDLIEKITGSDFSCFDNIYTSDRETRDWIHLYM